VFLRRKIDFYFKNIIKMGVIFNGLAYEEGVGIERERERDAFYNNRRRDPLPPIAEMPRKREVLRGAPEQDVVTHQRGKSTQRNIHSPKCH
jgi:hypothetical protein